MKIFIDQFCLADGGEESPKNLSINGQQAVQSVTALGSTTADVYPRGNRVNTVAFAVTREHASDVAAQGFLFQHAATLPSGGTVTFLCESVDGETVRYTGAASAVASDQGTQLGPTSTHRYTLVCGAISGGEPGQT